MPERVASGLFLPVSDNFSGLTIKSIKKIFSLYFGKSKVDKKSETLPIFRLDHY